MKNLDRRIRLSGALLILGLMAGFEQGAYADSTVLSISGAVSNSTADGAEFGGGDYTLSQLEAAGAAVGTVTADGLTGIPVWSLLGGDSSGSSDVVTSTPPGDNAKNAILRYYIVATTITGAQSILSLGEIDPFFGGTGSVPDFIAFSGTGGPLQLVFPSTNASGRDVLDLASLQVLAAPALATGPGGVSSSFTLSGSVAQPGSYNLASLQALPAVTASVNGDSYTGVSLWNLLDVDTSNILNSYVLASGTDGYEALYSLAELDPQFGAPQDLVPYADSQGQFPADGFARIVIPGDNHLGRYISNLDSLEVTSVPEPRLTLPLLAALMLLGLIRARRGRVSDRTIA